MKKMFENSKFNGDISRWDVSKVKDMSSMFFNSKFNNNISKWNVSGVRDMISMFTHSIFNKDISNWDVSKVIYYNGIFIDSKIESKYVPVRFRQKE